MNVGGDAHAQEEVEDDPIPNELDNALVHLLPAIKACGSDPSLPTYLDLAKFEELAGPVLREGVVSEGGAGAAGKEGGGKRRLDERVLDEIEVAFRHCMHEAGLALAGVDVGGGRGGKGGRRAAAAGSELMAEPMGILSLALAFVDNEAGLDESDGGNSSSASPALLALPLLLLEDFMESQARTRRWLSGERLLSLFAVSVFERPFAINSGSHSGTGEWLSGAFLRPRCIYSVLLHLSFASCL